MGSAGAGLRLFLQVCTRKFERLIDLRAVGDTPACKIATAAAFTCELFERALEQCVHIPAHGRVLRKIS